MWAILLLMIIHLQFVDSIIYAMRGCFVESYSFQKRTMSNVLDCADNFSEEDCKSDNVQVQKKASRVSKLSKKQKITTRRNYDHGGPTAPEASTFTSAGTTNMVNLATGDFSYNIPLMDVGGYPVNLNYDSQVGVNDEASWVGLGWSLNAGSVNRSVRGLPDDFRDVDILKEANIKEKVTVGAAVGVGVQIAGIQLGGSGSAGVGLNLGLEIEHDNYEGFSTALGMGGNVRAGGSNFGGGIGLDISVSSTKGATFSPSLSMSGNFTKSNIKASLGGYLGATFDSREGYKSLQYGISSNISTVREVGEGKKREELGHEVGGLNSNFSHSFASPSFSPPFEIPTHSITSRVKATLGGEVKPVHIHGELEFNTHNQFITREFRKKSFGYLYSQYGGEDALHDFNRANEGVYYRETPTLPITAYTYDLYNVSAHGLNTSFRPKRNDIGTVHTAHQRNSSDMGEGGLEVGVGDIVHIGANVIVQVGSDVSTKWTNGNLLAESFGFKDTTTSAEYEPIYFQNTGELIPMQGEETFNKLGGFEPVRANLHRGDDLSTANTTRTLSNGQEINSSSDVVYSNRKLRNKLMSYRSIGDMRHAGELTTRYYTDVMRNVSSADPAIPSYGNKSDHLIQEIEVVNEEGIRYKFGLPAYNNFINELSFNVGHEAHEDGQGNVTYQDSTASIHNTKGENHYYLKTTTPAHAYAWYVTEILSSDYSDLTLNGPSPDDLGSYTSFKYKRVHSNYLWRNPQEEFKANFQEGEKHTEDDNSGSILFGGKEIYYVDKIQTRNYTAEFYSSPRRDGFGVRGQHGGTNPNAELYKLDSIKLFAAFTNNTSTLTPVKTVFFEYDYSLCNNNPSTVREGINPSQNGKLTLKKISFAYGNSKKAKQSPYEFSYGNNPEYHAKKVDRWGNYKRLIQEDFPYTNQNKVVQNIDASAWLLDSIKTPQNATMKIEYESDDYAFVQDKNATVMYKIKGVCREANGEIDPVGALKYNGYINRYLVLSIPRTFGDPMITRPAQLFPLFEHIHELYFSSLVQVVEPSSGLPSKLERITGFIPINFSEADAGRSYGLRERGSTPEQTDIWIKLPLANQHSEVAYSETPLTYGINMHPFTLAAREYIMIEKPLLIKPDHPEVPRDIEQAFDDLGTTFDEVFGSGGLVAFLERHNRALSMNYEGSMVRLNHFTQAKKGGGARVKSIMINDNWDKMQVGTNSGQINGVYGTEYSYNDGEISSGVASYEPMIGKDENPLVQPIHYSRRRVSSINVNNYQLEPLGDIFYQYPTVIYSKVTQKSITAVRITQHGTGYSIQENYTAKDFPYRYKKTDKFFVGKEMMIPTQVYNRSEIAEVVTQGFVVEINDMHGKLKKQSEYDQYDNLISSTEYIYKTNADGSLNNVATVINPRTMATAQKAIGVECDYYVDANQQISAQEGGGAQLNLEIFSASFIPFPLFIPVPVINQFYTEFRSHTITKFITRVGLLDHVISRKFGSSQTNKNVAYDGESGRVILTELDNEFDKKYYNLDIPAYWAYNGMSHASTNQGLKLKNILLSGSSFSLPNAQSFYTEGDELLLFRNDSRGTARTVWVSKVDPRKVQLIQANGRRFDDRGIFTVYTKRSGRKNLLSASVGNIVTVENPINSNDLNLNPRAVLQAGAVTYSDYWQTNVAAIRTESEGTCDCFIVDPNNKRNTSLRFPLNLKSKKADIFIYPNYAIVPIPGQSCGITISTADGSPFCDSSLVIDFEIPVENINNCMNGRTLRGKGNSNNANCNQEYILSSDCMDLVICESRNTAVSMNCNSGGIEVNPFINGILGNYRSNASHFVNTKRTEGPIYDAGLLDHFEPFWILSGDGKLIENPSKTIWQRGDQVVKVNSKGDPVEVLNALNIPSASIYQFGNNIMAANAVNARMTDVAFDGFEDYSSAFTSRYSVTGTAECRISSHFILDGATDIDPVGIDNEVSHSGNKSIKLSSGGKVEYRYSSLQERTRSERTARLTSGSFTLETGDITMSFSPEAEKEYYFSVWLHCKNNDLSSFSDIAEVEINGETFYSSGVIIDGWQQVSGKFRQRGSLFLLQLKNSSAQTIWFDDIKIQPFNSNMEAYIYTNDYYRLVAKLDEQNYASFYEYDAEGKLERTKKETEQGVYTIQEIRTELPK